jgi:hypothetical protein
MPEITTDSRKYVRQKIGEGNIIQLTFATPQNSQYSTNSLIVNSSFGGVQVLLVSQYAPQPEQSISINFDELASFPGRIAWVKQLDTNIYKLGIKYLE